MSAIDGAPAQEDYRIAHKEAPYVAEWFCLNEGSFEAMERSALMAARQGTPQTIHFHEPGMPCRRLAPGRDCVTYKVRGLQPIYRLFHGR